MIKKLKILMANPVLDVTLAASKEIVDDSDFMSLEHQLVNQMRSHKASTTSYLQSISSAAQRTTTDWQLDNIVSTLLSHQKLFHLLQKTAVYPHNHPLAAYKKKLPAMTMIVRKLETV